MFISLLDRTYIRDDRLNVRITEGRIARFGRHGDPGVVARVICRTPLIDELNQICVTRIANKLAGGQFLPQGWQAQPLRTMAGSAVSRVEALSLSNSI